MEGLTVSDANLTVYIHPSMTNKVRGAILTQLSSLLFRYSEDLEGVLLAYQVNVRSKVARILPGLVPHFGVKLKATLLLFAPKPGMFIEGKVVKIGRESIHAIVLGFSSAAIMLGDIREEFKFQIEKGTETYISKSHKGHRIKVGSIIRFALKSMDEEILHISGSLIPPNTGCIHWLSKYGMEHDPHTKRSAKRRLEKERDSGSSHSAVPRRPHKCRRTRRE
ncbi:hypothetical protein KSP39_PZI009921 [Platanthera zijinensis]|uniref:DNA-directed RNA polymerase subunit n=1 Tax=Platanthera zijinensis TaxID=2320716 RepID=A0AAP0G704_9ASPA